MQTLRPQAVVEGLGFPEGIRYHGGKVWFSDIFDFKVLCWDPVTHATTTVAELPDKPSGLGFLPDGTLLVATIGELQLLRLDAGGPKVVVDLKALCGTDHHLNDMVVDARGRAYIGAIDNGDHARREGSIVLVEPDGSAKIAAAGMAAPNGMAITADGSTLVAADNGDHTIVAFDIAPDGGLRNRRVLAKLDAFPDGLCLDAENAAWVGVPFAAEFRRIDPRGNLTQRVACDPGRVAIAPMLGGPGRRTLYLCTAQRLPPGEHARVMQHPTRLPESVAACKGALEAVDGITPPGAGWP
jgi:sugar lactone lactonase YvrE